MSTNVTLKRGNHGGRLRERRKVEGGRERPFSYFLLIFVFGSSKLYLNTLIHGIDQPHSATWGHKKTYTHKKQTEKSKLRI